MVRLKRPLSKKGSYMARYKEYDYSQGKFIPIHFDKQILPGTFEYSLHYLIDNEIDLSALDRFTLRGKPKVNMQWLFYCIVHNLTKVYRYGEGFAWADQWMGIGV